MGYTDDMVRKLTRFILVGFGAVAEREIRSENEQMIERDPMKPFFHGWLLIGLAAVVAGCATTKPDLSGNWNRLKNLVTRDKQRPDAGEGFGQPVSMAVMWKSSVYEKPGSPSVRGFGGRVFFYDANSQPVKADGELVVYGYDESTADENSGDDDSGADKKFVFPPDRFQSHFSQTDLGPSYSVWIPWEKVGGYRKSVTLIPVFKTADGQLLRCGHSVDVLPGKKPDSQDNLSEISAVDVRSDKNRVSQASFQASSNDQNSVAAASHVVDESTANTSGKKDIQRVRTTTFNVPPSLARRMSMLPQGVPGSVNENAIKKPATTSDLDNNKERPSASVADSSAGQTNRGKANESERGEARIFGVPGTR